MQVIEGTMMTIQINIIDEFMEEQLIAKIRYLEEMQRKGTQLAILEHTIKVMWSLVVAIRN